MTEPPRYSARPSIRPCSTANQSAPRSSRGARWFRDRAPLTGATTSTTEILASRFAEGFFLRRTDCCPGQFRPTRQGPAVSGNVRAGKPRTGRWHVGCSRRCPSSPAIGRRGIQPTTRSATGSPRQVPRPRIVRLDRVQARRECCFHVQGCRRDLVARRWMPDATCQKGSGQAVDYV